jgi:hypothetical protein
MRLLEMMLPIVGIVAFIEEADSETRIQRHEILSYDYLKASLGSSLKHQRISFKCDERLGVSADDSNSNCVGSNTLFIGT